MKEIKPEIGKQRKWLNVRDKACKKAFEESF